jgi:methylmalonyl-CoA/ethylmalonyl-CoA epimerase
MGFVVASIQASGEPFANSLNGSWDRKIIHDPIQRVHVSFITLPGTEVSMELVEPAGVQSPVQAFLEKGGGLHHICYEVLDCESALVAMRRTGALIVRRPKPAVAFDGRSIAWVLTTQKLLVELLETAAK